MASLIEKHICNNATIPPQTCLIAQLLIAQPYIKQFSACMKAINAEFLANLINSVTNPELAVVLMSVF